MDFLLACAERVQESVFFSVAHLLNLEVDVIFFDTTSTYFEVDIDDPSDDGADADGEAAAHTEAPLRRLGHSKDHRPDLPQVVIGLAVTLEGIPVRVWVWPGNANDQTLVAQVKADLAGWRLGRAIHVVDSGFSGRDNLRRLRSAGGHYIAGLKLRSGMAESEQALSRQGRYRAVKDNLGVKEVRVGDGEAAVRYVVCHNPAEAERDHARRQQRLERIEAELARLKTQRQRATTTAERQAHSRGECALRDHPTLSRSLRQSPSGRLALDRAKIAAEKRLDGKYLLTTSDPASQPRTSRSATSNCSRPSAPSATARAPCSCGPSSTAQTTGSAHVLICFLALVIVRLAETRTGATWRTIRAELGQIRHGHFRSSEGDFTQTSELTATRRDLHTALGIPEPPRFGRITPAATPPQA